MTELKSFDRVAHLYDETRGLPSEVDRQIAAVIVAVLQEMSAAPRLLEIGIGTGRMAAPLAALGIRVAGTDISSKMVAFLRAKRRDIDVVYADAARPPFRGATFDAVLFVHILHLVADQEATLRAAVPLLRSRGKLILGFETYDGIRLKADDVMEAIGRELLPDMTTGRGNQQRNLAAFHAVAAEGGTIEHRVAATWRESITARAILDSNANRHGSGSWKISQETMQEMLRRAEPQLVDLFGGIDTPREFNRTFELLIASPAGTT